MNGNMMVTPIENSRVTLDKLKKQIVGSRFMRWWVAELSSLVPGWMRSSALDASRFAPVPLQSVHAQMTPVQSTSARLLALTVPNDRILRKTITLPLATEENLRQVLEFQVEQHTPFVPGQVYFGYLLKSRDFERGQLTVDFVATPRGPVDAALKTLSELGTPAQAVFSQDMLAADELLNLLPSALATKSSALRLGANPWLAGLVGVLALAALAMPIVIKREAVVQMFPWVEKGKKAAETVDAMRRELDARVEQHNYLLEKRQLSPTVIQVLEELTRVLPDDTWVQALDLKGKELQIQGETASSVRLIGLFEQSSLFKDASFRSSLTKGQLVGTEHYQLALQVRPAPKPASAPASSPTSASASAPAVAVSGVPLQAASVPQTAGSAPQPAGEKKP